ncbi:MAG: sulfatase-like hydrolase/transferase, partial [bacterium]
MKKLILIIIAFFLLFATLLAQQTENAFIVVIDGARYSETFGDETHQYIPKIWNQLRPMGAIYNSFYIDGWTLTNSGHASIITGTWQKIANDGSERPHKPTLFEYFRKQHNTSITENYVVLGKDKLKILTHSNHSEYGSNYRASVKTSVSQYNDIKTWENIKEVITAHHPRLMIVNLAETDASGHSGVWNSYVSALQQADSLVSELWTLIQSDSIYSNKTTLFVTNDHGRHSGSFSSHGDSCEGCQHIMLLVIGPDTPAGVTDEATWKQIDIVPTVGYLLNFDTPYCTGTTISTAIATNVSMVELNFPRTINLSQNYPNPFNSS